MKQTVPETVHAIDAEGYLVRLPDETDEAYMTRTATVLHQSGHSANDPALVMSQYDEPDPPPPEMNEGETQQDYEKRIHEQREEWGKKNAENRKAAFEKTKHAADDYEPAVETVQPGPHHGQSLNKR